MTSPRFYSALPLPRPCIPGVVFAVGEAVARHLQVLRLAIGDAIVLFDGAGGEFSAAVADIGKRHATVTITGFDATERESPLQVSLVQALATADKMDLIVQKAVELGVTEIAPVASARATLKLAGERAEKRVVHWQAIAIAACEQCGRNRIPVIRELQTLEQWLAATRPGTSLLLDPHAEKSLLDNIDTAASLALLIGPEGGFAPDEIARAIERGVMPVKFGPRTLRVETAGLAALAALNALHGDLR